MHLAPDAVTPAVKRPLSILGSGSVLYLSWRVTEGEDRRDEHGRLYASFESDRVLHALAGTEMLLDEQVGNVTVTQRKYLKAVVDNINKVSLAVSQLNHFPTDDTLDLDDFCLRDLLHDTAQVRKSSPQRAADD